jgi:hypothetical protein
MKFLNACFPDLKFFIVWRLFLHLMNNSVWLKGGDSMLNLADWSRIS